MRHNVIFFFGAAAVGALNYLYYPVMGRLLDPQSFGEVQTLISLFLIITIFLTVLGLVVVNVVANNRSSEGSNEAVLEIEKLALWTSLSLLALAIVFGRQLASFLQFNSVWPFILLALAITASVPFTLRGAYLRGLQRFGHASSANLVSAGGKLLLGIILVGLGLKTAGAMGGLIVAQLMACAAAATWAARAGFNGHPRHWLKFPRLSPIKPQLGFIWLVLASSLVVTFQVSLDVVIVKHYFDPETAGLYSGVATVARIIFFLTASFTLVMISSIKLEAEKSANRRILMYSILLTLAVGLPAAAICIFAPHQLTALFMGSAYQQLAGLLPKLAAAILIVSVLNVLVSYFLALRRFSALPILLAGAGLTYILMIFNHATLQAVVNNLLIGSGVMLGLLLAWTLRSYLKELSWQEEI
jgi:O-antigen/teichoic acid export membrane protein